MKLFLGIQSVFLSILLRESSGRKVQRKSLSYDFDHSDGNDPIIRPRDGHIQRRKHRSKKKHFRREGSDLNDPEIFSNMSINENMMVDMPSNMPNMFLNMHANIPTNMLGQSQLHNMPYYPAASVSILNEEPQNSLENINGIPSQIMRWPNPGPMPPPWPGNGWPGSAFPYGSQFGFPPGFPPFGPPGVPPGFPPVVPPGVPPWSPYGMPPPQFPPGWPPPGFGWNSLPFNLKPEDFLPDGTNIEDLLKNFEVFWPGLHPKGNQTSTTSETSSQPSTTQKHENITTPAPPHESPAGRAGLQRKMTSPVSEITKVSTTYSPHTSTTMFPESTTRQTMHRIAIRGDHRGIRKGKDREIRIDIQREVRTDNDREVRIDNDREVRTGNDREIRTDNDREVRTGNDREIRTDNDREVRIDNDREVQIDNDIDSERQRSPREGPEPGSLLFDELIGTVSSRPPTFDIKDFDHAQMIDNALGIETTINNDRYGIVDRVPHAHLRPTQTIISYKPQTKSRNMHMMPKYGTVQRTNFFPNSLFDGNL